MDELYIPDITSLLEDKIGVEMRGSRDPLETRKGLIFWFANYNRGNGPVFSIRPTGLKRLVITFKFGAYAAACVDHTKSHASHEDFLLANAFFEQLDHEYDLRINGEPFGPNWEISSDLKIEATRKISERISRESIVETVNLVMVPIVASVAELVGYEERGIDAEEAVPDEEGSISHALTLKRERSMRNRLLCLSIHGDQCGVCEFQPSDLYGSDMPSILEVHHIEPLGEIEQPKAYDPKTDLIPLCPNCHRAIHKRRPAYTPAELKGLLRT